MQPRTFLSVFFILLATLAATLSAQTEQLVTTQNEPIEYTFLSQFTPSIGQSPSHGSIELVESPRFHYTLTYTPDQDFLGLDEFLLVYHPFGYSLRFQNFKLEIKLADVRARRDQASVAQGATINIPALDNDYSNVGSLTLRSVPIVNSGTAAVEGDQILFTPAPGFVGLTDLNYVVCTTTGVCDLGTVTVNVTPATGGASDTVRVFTKRGQRQFIFAPPSAVQVGQALHGTLADSNGVLTYVPDADFVGLETLVYEEPGSGGRTTFEVNVLDMHDNAFAVEDRGHTATNTPLTLNVLHNDLYTVFSDCIAYGTPRYGSLVESGNRGEVTYHPPAGWSGVDQFTYSSKSPGCRGEAELTTVYVFVSDYAPVNTEAELDLPAGSATEVTYRVPNGEVTWTEQQAPLYGTLTKDATTGGLVYTANEDAAGRTDYFQIGYCLEAVSNSGCTHLTVQLVKINIGASRPDGCSGPDCVWPGDTNNDGVVDVSDLLPIGAMMGRSGTPRLAADPGSWAGQGAEDWGVDFDGYDIKHVDANGDNIISAADTAVVMANIGRAHRLRGEAAAFTAFDLSLIGPEAASPGDLIQLDIIAGNETVIVEDIYGFILPIHYDQQAVADTTMRVTVDEASWISYDSPLMGLSRNNTEAGVLNLAMTRTNGESASGYGIIGKLETVIVEDIYGFALDPNAEPTDGTETARKTLTFGGGTGTATSKSGRQTSVSVLPLDVPIVNRQLDLGEESSEEANAFLNAHLLAFPNPVSDRLTVHLNGQQQFTQVQLADVTGRVVLQRNGLATNHRVVDVSSLATGMYSLTVTTRDGVANRLVYVQ